MKFKLLSIASLLIFVTLLFNQPTAHTFSSTPPANKTGAPGAGTCADCHSGTLGSGSVAVVFNDNDLYYNNDSTYNMSVVLLDAEQVRWGFSMVARDSMNNNIGSWIAGPNTKIHSNFTHISHLNAPNEIPNGYTFNFAWMAPANYDGTVTFYVAGNAANANFDDSGDHIYLNNLSIEHSLTQIPPTMPCRVTLLLEGAYRGNDSMRTDIYDGELLPPTQHYEVYPWLYSGTEAMVVPPTTSPTDWVLLELYRATDTTLVTKAAALLYPDGKVASPGNDTAVIFQNIPAGNYFLLARHRNHLAVMSRTTIMLPNSNGFDFTASLNTVMGSNQLAQLSNGKYALRAGDFNADGRILIDDFNLYVLVTSLINTYYRTDGNLDRQVTVADFNAFAPNISSIGVEKVRY